MGRCHICGKDSRIIPDSLSLCRECIQSYYHDAEAIIRAVHVQSRMEFDLPEAIPPRADNGIVCPQCGNACSIPPDEVGFCGLKTNKQGRLYQIAGTPGRGHVEWYYDPLPTNCVASWICPEGEACPAQDKSFRRRGKNLAVFYASCTFNCLFCQNWHFRENSLYQHRMSASDLADAVDADTRCVCYFGGDPASQISHAIAASEKIRRRSLARGQNSVRICWETNGSMSRPFIKKMMQLSLDSGGLIKMELKAFDTKIHHALTGTSNATTLSNFSWLADSMLSHRHESPPLVASTLLVPGYITAEEVYAIARFIAGNNPDIPYSLLAFYPHFYFPDLPTTSKRHAEEALSAAHEAGLRSVHIGNRHLLSRDDY